MESSRPLRRRSLAATLALAFAAGATLLTLILVGVIGATAGDQVRADIGSRLAELARQTSDKLDRGMFERYREVSLIARRFDHGDRAPSRQYLSEVSASYPYYAWIGAAGLDGRVIASNNGMLEGVDVRQRTWYRNALQDLYVGDVHDAVLMARLRPEAGKEPARFVDIAFPYHDRQGRVAGVLGAHLSWEWAAEEARSIVHPRSDNGVEALILARDGTVLMGPASLQGQRLNFGSGLGESGSVTQAWADGKRYVVGYSTSAGHAGYPGLGWRVLVRQEAEQAFSPLYQVRRKVLWSGMLVALLLSLCGVWIARRISRPLHALSKAAAGIERGEVMRITEYGGDFVEVQSLARSLTSLVAKLRLKETALTELNQTLEGRVETRTAELAAALLEVQQIDKMKTEFVSIVSHELRTPITSIRFSLNMLADGSMGQFEPDVAKLLDIANKSCERLVRLINDILDIEKMEAGLMEYRFAPASLKAVATAALEATEAYAAQFKVGLSMAADADDVEVTLDRDRMAQVLVNLLSNASKFSPSGGQAQLTIKVGHGTARVSVIDHGDGISENFRSRLFQKFAQADGSNTRTRSGTGLGLAICREIVQAHGGTITYETEAGKGTVFHVDLPLGPRPDAAPAARPTS
ncbi:MAG: sensor histidine kinase [Pseudomonadota bacterium]